jgi:hypothetical protein
MVDANFVSGKIRLAIFSVISGSSKRFSLAGSTE